ncbi:patellin-4 [Oryza brachyantha]|uniref:CRAL-TRIO domain-containing protein n=1 Tax=Oryza brachyantha TaxID=4533 RepID=J3MGS0_ORYBR|nr:patellin-4 [Oryza brachyantha]
MAVEVVVSEGVAATAAAEVVAPEAKEVSGEAADEAVTLAAVVSKNASFREESNFLDDLKDGERKALAELRAKVEEAIVEGKLFDDAKKKAAADETAAGEKKDSEKKAAAAEEAAGENKDADEKKEEGRVTEKKEEEPVTEEKKEEELGEEQQPKKEEAGEGEKAVAAEEKPAAEVTPPVVVDKDIALWGVPLLPSKGDDATDVVLLKFLRARDFKAGAAFDMLRKTLLWRRDWKGFAATDDVDVAEELPAELADACYLDGADREGHPVCYNAPGVFADDAVYKKALGTEEGKARFLRWRVRAMESHVAKLDFKPGGVASLLQVTDLKNSPGPAKKDLRVAMKQVLELFQDNYPELVARNILINVPFWYYAFSTLLYPFMTQRTKSKFVIARPSKVTETLLKYISIEAIPVKYGGLKRDDDTEFSSEDSEVTELIVKASSTETIEIEATEGDTTLTWDLTVLGWEVNYKEEFVPSDEGSYTVIVRKGKKMGSSEAAVRNSFRAGEPGKVVLTVENLTLRKKKVLFRHKARSACAKKC